MRKTLNRPGIRRFFASSTLGESSADTRAEVREHRRELRHARIAAVKAAAARLALSEDQYRAYMRTQAATAGDKGRERQRLEDELNAAIAQHGNLSEMDDREFANSRAVFATA